MQYEIDATVVVDAASEKEAFDMANRLSETVENLNCGVNLDLQEGVECVWPSTLTVREEAARDLERVGWYGPAGDIRDSVDVDTVLDRISQDAQEDEIERAIPILARLSAKLEDEESNATS